MRIIGGQLKGKSILPPNNYAARPTTDFAKEGLFNMLTNEFDIEEISVLDLFSGTGSISMEFASRGCKDIISIEMNPLHTRFIKQCSQSFKIKGMQVIRHNVFDFIKICTKSFDIIFADPPYDLEGLDTLPDRIFGLTSENIPEKNTIAAEENSSGAEENSSGAEENSNCSEKISSVSEKNSFGSEEKSSISAKDSSVSEKNLSLSEKFSSVSEKNSADSEKKSEDFEKKLKNLVKKGGYFILEHPKAYSFENHPLFIKEKKYGNVHFSFFGEKE